jgi:hypothetical protein
MTPLNKIETGIMTANWGLVCEGFNKLTGKKLAPPAPKEEPKAFNPETAGKKQLYDFLKGFMQMEPMKSYSTEELREMALVHSMEETYEDSTAPNVAQPTQEEGGPIFLDGFRFTSGKKKLLPMDMEKVVATLDPQLALVKDPTNEYNPRKPPKKVQVRCLKCKKSFEQLAGLAVEVDGEKRSMCPVCSETV